MSEHNLGNITKSILDSSIHCHQQLEAIKSNLLDKQDYDSLRKLLKAQELLIQLQKDLVYITDIDTFVKNKGSFLNDNID